MGGRWELVFDSIKHIPPVAEESIVEKCETEVAKKTLLQIDLMRIDSEIVFSRLGSDQI
jgi:hypothetical protein